MVGAMQPWHWIVLIAIVLLLFGAGRLPGLAKSVGQSMKIFRSEIKDLRDDGKDTKDNKGDPASASEQAPKGDDTTKA